MKPATKILFLLAIAWSFVLVLSSANALGESPPVAVDQERFENAITIVSDKYIGIPYGYGKTGVNDGAVDNSHLFHLIYQEAAGRSGIRYLGYAPMKKLLERTFEVSPEDIRIGDLVVLNSGLAAMIYNFEDPDKFHLIYVSHKRERVTSFNNHNLLYDVYWLKNLKGFYRLSPYNFLPITP